MILKVLSWNIWRGKYLDKVIGFLKEKNPDVIALQEVIESETVENLAKQIADQLGYQYIFCKALEAERHGAIYKIGNAVLTKYEIVSESCNLLSQIDRYKNSAETEPRVATEIIIKTGDKNIRVISVHLAYSPGFKPSETRNFQVQNLIKLLPGEKTILMGDFNSHPDGEAVTEVGRLMENPDKKLDKPTWTMYPFNFEGFSETKLRHRIDYIFISSDIKVHGFKVEESDGSDHLPISAVLEI